MAMKVESVDHSSFGLKIEGDLGDLQIIEESDEENELDDREGESPNEGTVANIANSLVKASTTPVFGNVQLVNSNNAQFGNNTFFNGPVTIKQVIQTTSGVDNASYQKTDDETLPSGKFPKELSAQEFQVKTWHKLTCLTIGVIVLLASICAIVMQQQNQQINSNVSESDDSSTRFPQVVVPLSLETFSILLSVLFITVTCLVWIVHSLLTNGSGFAYCDGKGQNTVKRPVQYCKIQKAHDLLIAPEHLRIVSRTDWLAQPVEEKIEAIRQPVPWVIVTHTATKSCFEQSSCVLQVRLMQTFHIESKHWSDIAYNFLVGGDGSAYFGRGWDQVGAHTKGYNKYAMSIAFIGTFNKESPTKHQVEACRKLIKLGVASGKIAKDYKLLAHRQLMSTLSPGDTVYDIIKTWPNFYNDTDISQILPKY